MSGVPMVPGSKTDTARLEGGEALYRDLQALLAGQSIPAVIYALTSCLGVVAINVSSSESAADRFASVVLDDVRNFVALNFDEMRAQVVTMRQQQAANPGSRAQQ